ncbi:MAG: tRNA (adenosine(37)-N6)-dimethylallyltransferase MiaA [Ignavibacteriales bacterium CG_4_9_14_3_um_filter_34_10]|nr:MAG: tRNA (adenosine(37)-N6)-dimethylallyltransferase MiaA [Ignavibacteriales bacterium CG_4_9_14_3_um_filter_34_10]
MERVAAVIVGPTCSGKTKLALAISDKVNSEIISADSRQIFKLLNIGTAKPSKQELHSVKHHFIDLLNPDEEFNVSKFEKESLKIIEDLFQTDKLPIVVGGSGLYIKTLIDGIIDVPDTDPNFRKELLEIRKEKGNEFLYEMLKSIDKQSADSMLPQNWKRVIRAIEIYKTTNQKFSDIKNKNIRTTDFQFMQFGLLWNRQELYDNIEKRVDEMIEMGLVEEVEKILVAGFSPALNSLNTVGYKEIINYLNKEISFEKAIEFIKRNTRRYAKRQMTWFNKDKRIMWIEVDNQSSFEKIADEILYDIKTQEYL